MLLGTAPDPFYTKQHCGCEHLLEDMINDTNSSNQGDEEGEETWQQPGFSLGGSQGAFLASLLGPIQQDTLVTACSEDVPPSGTINAPTRSGVASGSATVQSTPFGRFDSRSNRADMAVFDVVGSLPTQHASQNDSIPRLFTQPKQNLTNSQFFGMDSSAAAEFRAFFGSGNMPDVGGGLQSNSNAPSQGLSLLTMNAQPNLSGSGGLGQQPGSIPSLSGNLPVQNTLNLNNAMSVTAQDTLRSQVNLHNALNNSWQQQIQHPPLPLQQQVQQQHPSQLQHQHQMELQQQHLQQPFNLSALQQPNQLNNEVAWSDPASLGGTPQLPPEIKWKGRGRSSTFPLKLHQMLLDLEKQEGGTAIASFLPHGRGFQIHKPKEFAKEIMPNYFRMSTYSSFQRQLNLYDFQRIAEGPEKGAYWHELFLKDQPMLSTNMKRSKVKGATRARQDERLKSYERQKDLSGNSTPSNHR